MIAFKIDFFLKDLLSARRAHAVGENTKSFVRKKGLQLLPVVLITPYFLAPSAYGDKPLFSFSFYLLRNFSDTPGHIAERHYRSGNCTIAEHGRGMDFNRYFPVTARFNE